MQEVAYQDIETLANLELLFRYSGRAFTVLTIPFFMNVSAKLSSRPRRMSASFR